MIHANSSYEVWFVAIFIPKACFSIQFDGDQYLLHLKGRITVWGEEAAGQNHLQAICSSTQIYQFLSPIFLFSSLSLIALTLQCMGYV